MGTDVYDGLVVAHALCAVIGFGAIALSGVYGLTAERRERAGALEELRRYFARPPLAEGALVLVGVLGVAAALADPAGGDLGRAWTTIGLVIWLVATGLWTRVVRPAEAAIRGAVTPQAAGEGTAAPAGGDGAAVDVGPTLDAAGRRLSRAAAATSALFVIALGVMVFQPR